MLSGNHSHRMGRVSVVHHAEEAHSMMYLTSRGKRWYPRNGSTAATAKDRSEILAYTASHPKCSQYDVAICCFQGNHAAAGHLKALRKAGKIERIWDSYQVVG